MRRDESRNDAQSSERSEERLAPSTRRINVTRRANLCAPRLTLQWVDADTAENLKKEFVPLYGSAVFEFLHLRNQKRVM
jgi:hypothetical protein